MNKFVSAFVLLIFVVPLHGMNQWTLEQYIKGDIKRSELDAKTVEGELSDLSKQIGFVDPTDPNDNNLYMNAIVGTEDNSLSRCKRLPVSAVVSSLQNHDYEISNCPKVRPLSGEARQESLLNYPSNENHGVHWIKDYLAYYALPGDTIYALHEKIPDYKPTEQTFNRLENLVSARDYFLKDPSEAGIISAVEAKLKEAITNSIPAVREKVSAKFNREGDLARQNYKRRTLFGLVTPPLLGATVYAYTSCDSYKPALIAGALTTASGLLTRHFGKRAGEHEAYANRFISLLHGLYKSDDSVIEGASYYIIGEKHGDKFFVRYYRADGDLLETVSCVQDEFCRLRNKLDADAPKPQPDSYEIKPRTGIRVPIFRISYFSKGVDNTKSSSGDYIFFKDKNGNVIKSFVYNKETGEIEVDRIYSDDGKLEKIVIRASIAEMTDHFDVSQLTDNPEDEI